MQKKTNAQFAIEFIILIAFMFLIFLGFIAVITSKVMEAKETERAETAEDIAALVKNEIDLAKSMTDGYSRNFVLPSRVKGESYNIQIIDNREVVVNYMDKEHVLFLPENVVGNVGTGLNEIKRIDGVVYLGNIEPPSECNDGLDNDLDSRIDLDDNGCGDVSDNDETNCGDGVCEGGEGFATCNLDCGGLRLLLMKGTGNAVSFTENGNVVLKGTLTTGTTPVPSGEDEFIFRNSASEPVAIVNLVTGNMVIAGSLYEDQGAIGNPATNDFVVINSVDDIVSLIGESGDFYVKGTLEQGGSP